MTLGEQLRELRVRGPHGYMTLRDAAKRLGVSFVRWSHFENDRERPDPEFLAEQVAQVLGGDPDELLRLWEEWTEAPPLDLSQNICRKVWK